MTLTNLRKRIASLLAAAGLFVGSAAFAQNLVVNGDFENVDNSISFGGYNAVLILDWTAPTGNGYAYSHDGSLTSTGAVIPDYANGGPLAGGGSFYFTPNANSPDNTASNPIQQNIDVSSLLGGGSAPYTLSAFFSGYLTNGDVGTVQVDFVDMSGAILGSDSITDSDPSTWTQESTSGMVPSGTTNVRVSAYGTALSGGPDGYIDNIDFRIVPEPSTAGLAGIGLATVWSLRRKFAGPRGRST